MILYFTGTGNSAFAAHRIAEQVQDECMDLLDKIRQHDYREIPSEKPFVIVCPTYGWRIPRILEQWLNETALTGNDKVYFVMTCGGDIGNASAWLKKFCSQKQMNFMGCAEIVMPENYIAMFSAPDQKEAEKIVSKALPAIKQTAEYIKEGRKLPNKNIGISDRLKSGVVNAAYYPMYVNAKKFYVKDLCIGCGICSKNCPTNTIHMVDGKPVWGEGCTHCMACICGCPKEAIEYGKKSQGKPRYHCPDLGIYEQ